MIPDIAEPLAAQFDSGVYELKGSESKAAYRAVYYVKLMSGVYVLHAFQKKSKSSKGIPREDVEIIRLRLSRAKEMDREAIRTKTNTK